MWRRLALVVLLALAGPASAQAQASCTKAQFEAVVDEAAAALREINATHKPAFQERLRQLKAKRGWDHDTFMVEAAPFVQDDQIAQFDQQSQDFLDRISSLGTEGAAAPKPDCGLLLEVRSNMAGLVATQKAKWAYMFEKIGKEIGP